MQMYNTNSGDKDLKDTHFANLLFVWFSTYILKQSPRSTDSADRADHAQCADRAD